MKTTVTKYKATTPSGVEDDVSIVAEWTQTTWTATRDEPGGSEISGETYYLLRDDGMTVSVDKVYTNGSLEDLIYAGKNDGTWEVEETVL